MTTLNKTIAAVTAAMIASTGTAFADGHALDVGSARLDVSLDSNGDGEVTDAEIIDGNVALFDINSNGFIDANERGLAEQMVMSAGTIDAGMMSDAMGSAMTTDVPTNTLNLGAARLSAALDRNGDGEVTDEEVIDGNMAFFDLDGNGRIDADERGIAQQKIDQGGVIEVVAMAPSGAMNEGAATTFDAGSARLDVSLDTNGDGEVSDDEIIDGNVAVFDTNGNGMIDANERGEAEVLISNS